MNDSHYSPPLLEVRELATSFFTDEGEVKAVDNVSFTIEDGESVGIVGESGSGKSVTALSVMQMVSRPGRITAGEIYLRGEDLRAARPRRLEELRGSAIALIFQEPMTSLDPLYTIGNQITEAITRHQKLKGQAARACAIASLRSVGIPEPEKRVDSYPHELSGGMRQRVMIAIALSCNPSLLIADEPTTALDVTVQARILDLLRDIRNSRQMALMLITHNLGIVAEMCDRVIVMHQGRIVEHKPVVELFENPEHPYTKALLASIPRLSSPPKTPLPVVQWT